MTVKYKLFLVNREHVFFTAETLLRSCLWLTGQDD